MNTVPEQRGLGLLRAAVADDNDEMRSLVSSVLRGCGFAVSEVTDGLGLVTLVRRDPSIALVVTDLQMPRLTGLRAIKQLRRLGFDAPIVLMTAFGNPRIHVDALRAGASAALDKPFSVSALRALVLPLTEKADEPSSRRAPSPSVVTKSFDRPEIACHVASPLLPRNQ